MAPLKAIVFVCTLNPSPARSSSDLLGRQLADELAAQGVEPDVVRVVDHDIRPGVKTDMGGGDEWPALREKVLGADIVAVATPIWLGQPASTSKRVMERLNAELSETDDAGRILLFGKVGLVAVVGNEDGAHHTIAEISAAMNEVGLTIPAQGSTYWVGEAMHSTDYQDLPETPENTARTTATAARHAAHLARLLKDSQYPPAG